MLANIGEILRSTALEVALECSLVCSRRVSLVNNVQDREEEGGGGGYLTNSVHARLGRIFDINDIM